MEARFINPFAPNLPLIAQTEDYDVYKYNMSRSSTHGWLLFVDTGRSFDMPQIELIRALIKDKWERGFGTNGKLDKLTDDCIARMIRIANGDETAEPVVTLGDALSRLGA